MSIEFNNQDSRLGYLNDKLDDLLEGINASYGEELFNELVSRLDRTINDFNDSTSCGFNSCSIYSSETWNVLYDSGSTVIINQISDINFCGGEVNDTDTSLQLTIDFQVNGNIINVSYDYPSSDGSILFVQKTYERI